MDRQLSRPQVVHYDYNEFVTDTTHNLVDIKEIDDGHNSPNCAYTISEDAKQKFVAIHDELNS